MIQLEGDHFRPRVDPPLDMKALSQLAALSSDKIFRGKNVEDSGVSWRVQSPDRPTERLLELQVISQDAGHRQYTYRPS